MSELRLQIVHEARRWIGTPYRHQASRIGAGCDCLGLLRGVWRALYGAEPEPTPAYAPDWAEANGREQLAAAARRWLIEIDSSDAAPGDVLLFRWRPHLPAKHAAILSAPDRMIHAYDGTAVAEVHFAPFWQRRLAYAFKFPGVAPQASHAVAPATPVFRRVCTPAENARERGLSALSAPAPRF
jgi:NlpC/P60 family putative phage cell wall peptidase